jgi:hypothetical protein
MEPAPPQETASSRTSVSQEGSTSAEHDKSLEAVWDPTHGMDDEFVPAAWIPDAPGKASGVES